MLAGPLGDDITTSGTTSSVLLGFLLVTYTIGNTRRHMRGRTIPRQPK